MSEGAGEHETTWLPSSSTIRTEAVRRIAAWVDEHRGDRANFEIVVEGVTSGMEHIEDRDLLEPLAEAGATWFIESRWGSHDTSETHGTYPQWATDGVNVRPGSKIALTVRRHIETS